MVVGRLELDDEVGDAHVHEAAYLLHALPGRSRDEGLLDSDAEASQRFVGYIP